MKLIPPIDTYEAFPYYRVGEYKFEDLCREIFSLLGGDSKKSCRNYGTRGQGQHGIDTLMRFDKEIWTAQSKAYTKFKKSDLTKVVKKFFKSIKKWKGENTSKFILFVGSRVEDTHFEDYIPEVVAKFAKEGIEFELCDADNITTLLKEKFPEIAVKHFGQFTGSCADIILERSTNDYITHPSREVLDDIENTRVEQLETIALYYRRGNFEEADNLILSQLISPLWKYIPEKQRSEFLIWRTRILLGYYDDVDNAEKDLEVYKKDIEVDAWILSQANIASSKGDLAMVQELLPSPKTIDEQNVVTSSLLNNAKFKEAASIIEKSKLINSPVTQIHLSLALFFDRKLNSAVESIEKALELEPQWVEVLRAAGKIYFYSAIVESAPNWGNFQSPAQFGFDFLKTDQDSINYLNLASDCFTKIAGLELPVSKPNWANDVNWKLCVDLANPATRERSKKEIKTRITEGEISSDLLDLSLKFQIEFDLSEVSQRYLQHLESHSLTVEMALALSNLLSFAGKYSQLRDFAVSKEVEIKQLLGGNKLQQLFLLQAAMGLDESDDVEKIVSESGSSFLHKIKNIHNEKSPTKANIPQISGNAESLDLYNHCVYSYNVESYSNVTDNEGGLLEAFPTESIISLISLSYSRQNLPAEVIRVLDENVGLFYNGELTQDLVRLKQDCYIQTGQPYKAKILIPSLTIEELTPYDNIRALYTYLNTGYGFKASDLAQKMLSEEEDASILISAARIIAPENKGLSKRLLDKAINLGVTSPEAAADALPLIFGNDEANRDNSELLKLALTAPQKKNGSFMKMMSIEEVKEMFSERSKFLEDIKSKYQYGQIPLCLTLTNSNKRLSDFVYNDPNSFWKSPYYIQAASRWRRRLNNSNFEINKVFLDATTILVLYKLNLLDVCVNVFDQVMISESVVTILRAEIESLDGEMISGSIIGLYNSIRSLLIEEKILKVQESINYADKAGQEVLHTLLKSEDLILVDDDFMENFRELGSERKLDEVFITVDDFIKKQEDSHRKQKGAMRILMSISAAKNLHQNEKFEDAVSKSDCHILSGDLNAMSEALKRNNTVKDRIKELKDCVSSLTDFIHRGKIVPMSAKRRSNELGEDAYSKTISDLFDEERASDVFTCVDDRMASRYTKIGESEIISVLDLIQVFRSRQYIQDADFYRVRNEMRSLDYRFIPLERKELFYWLDQIQGEKAVDQSDALDCIGRYYSAIARDSDVFCRVIEEGVEQEDKTEITFLLDLTTVTLDCLSMIWNRKNYDLQKKHTASNYIVTFFWGIYLTIMPEEETDNEHVLSNMSLIRLLHMVWQVNEKDKQHYINWMFGWFGISKRTWCPVLREVKKMLLEQITESKTAEEKIAIYRIYEALAKLLPEHLLTDYKINKEESMFFKDLVYSEISIGEYSFRFADLVDAAQSGNKLESRTRLKKKDTVSFSVKLEKSEGISILILSPDNDHKTLRCREVAMCLFLNTKEECLKYLSANHFLLDMTQEQFSQMICELYEIKDSEVRCQLLYLKLDRSLTRQRNLIQKKLQESGSLNLLESKPICIEAVLSYLCMKPSSELTIQQDLEKGALLVIDNFGIKEACRRFFSVPYSLPNCVIENFNSIDEDERLEIISSYEDRLSSLSPLEQIHLYALLVQSTTDTTELEQRLLSDFVRVDSVQGFSYFLSILKWSRCGVNELKNSSFSVRDCSVASWIHAGMLINVLGVYEHSKEAEKLFKENTREDVWFNLLDDNNVTELNILDPRFLDPVFCVLGGLSFMFQLGQNREVIVEKYEGLAQLLYPYPDSDFPSAIFFKYLIAENLRYEGLVFANLDALSLLEIETPTPDVERAFLEVIKVVNALEEDPYNTDHWAVFVVLVENFDPPIGVREKLGKILLKIDFTKFEVCEKSIVIAGTAIFKLASLPEMKPSAVDWESLFDDYLSWFDIVKVSEQSYIHLTLEAARSISFRGEKCSKENIDAFTNLVSKINPTYAGGKMPFCSILIKIAASLQNPKSLWDVIYRMRSI